MVAKAWQHSGLLSRRTRLVCGLCTYLINACKSNFSKVRKKWLPFKKKIRMIKYNSLIWILHGIINYRTSSLCYLRPRFDNLTLSNDCLTSSAFLAGDWR